MVARVITAAALLAAASSVAAFGPSARVATRGGPLRAQGEPKALTKDYGPLVLTLATTGNINTKERNADLPCSPQEMADDVRSPAPPSFLSARDPRPLIPPPPSS